jgi:HPt (histidine-containing phosphotransfer) domain-containing protein
VSRDSQLDDGHTITVSREFAELIPRFLENRRGELAALRAALARGDYGELEQLGHRMRGAGATYGFDRVSALGGRIEQCAGVKNRQALAETLAEYADHLGRLKVVYE